jgi:hypothetical protein
MEIEKGPPAPDLFPSVPGAVFPLYHALSEVLDFTGGTVVPVTSSEPLRACALVLQKGRLRRVLVANLTPAPLSADLDARWLGNRARQLAFDEHNFEEAVRSPEGYFTRRGSLVEAARGRYRLALLPYSITRLDRVILRN